MVNFIWFLVIGLAAGWLAGQLMRGGGFGLVGNLVVGVLGAIIGGSLLGVLGFYADSFVGSLISALLGAIVLLWAARFIRR